MLSSIENGEAIMNNLQFLSNITLDTITLQSYTEIDHAGDFAITQNTCIDGYVLRNECVTLTRDQVKELMINMQQYLGE